MQELRLDPRSMELGPKQCGPKRLLLVCLPDLPGREAMSGLPGLGLHGFYIPWEWFTAMVRPQLALFLVYTTQH